MRPYQRSHSALEDYEECPHRRKVLAGSGLQFRPMTIGSAVHRACQLYGQHCHETKQATDLMHRDIVAAAVLREFSLDPDEVADLEELLDNFAHQFVFHPSGQFEHVVEFGENFCLWSDWEGGKAWVGCTIDYCRLTEPHIAEITDYKSNRAIPTPSSRFFKRYERQLQRYAAMLLRATEAIEEVTARDFYLRFGVYGPAITVHRGEEAGILEQFKQDLLAMDADTECPPRPGDHCQVCPVASACPLMKDAPEGVVVITRPDQAKEFAAKCLALEGAAAQIKKALKEWCAASGPVDLEHGSFGYHVTEKGEYDGQAIEWMLDRWDSHILMRAIPLTKSTIETIVKNMTQPRSKERKAMMEDLKALQSKSLATTFRFKKWEEE